MIHVITQCQFIDEFPYRHFIEGLTTLAEEMYVKYMGIKVSKKRSNVNGYIPTFVRELNFIKDGRLLEEFIKDPNKMYRLFFSKVYKYNLCFGRDDKDFQREMKSIVRKNEKIVLMAKNKCSDQIINPLVKDLEEDILEQYLSSVYSGEEKFNTNKLIGLYNMQLQPNILKYMNFFKDLLSQKMINEDDIKECGKLGIFYFLTESEFLIDDLKLSVYEFTKSELDFIASMVFGYSLYVYDDQELLFDEIDIEKLYEEVEQYEDLMPLYRVIIQEVLNKGLNLDEIKNCYIKRCSLQKESFEMQALLRDIPKSKEELLLDAIFGGNRDGVGVFALEDDEGIKTIRDKAFFYFPVEASTFIEFCKQREGLNCDLLYNYLIKYEDFDALYVDRTVDNDIDCFGVYSITMFAQKGTDLFKINFSLVDGKINENIEIINFLDSKRSLFEKDTCEKLKSKNDDF